MAVTAAIACTLPVRGATHSVAYIDEARDFSEAEKKMLAVYEPWFASILAQMPKP